MFVAVFPVHSASQVPTAALAKSKLALFKAKAKSKAIAMKLQETKKEMKDLRRSMRNARFREKDGEVAQEYNEIQGSNKPKAMKEQELNALLLKFKETQQDKKEVVKTKAK